MQDYFSPSDGYKIPSGNQSIHKSPTTIEQHMNDRLRTLVVILNDIQSEINNRKRLKNSLTEQIDQSMCELSTFLHQLQELFPKENISTQNKIATQLDGLKGEKRDRETESWRDIAVLRKEFRSIYQEYRRVAERLKILEM